MICKMKIDVANVSNATRCPEPECIEYGTRRNLWRSSQLLERVKDGIEHAKEIEHAHLVDQRIAHHAGQRTRCNAHLFAPHASMPREEATQVSSRVTPCHVRCVQEVVRVRVSSERGHTLGAQVEPVLLDCTDRQRNGSIYGRCSNGQRN